ncbi:MAG TPA: hypothetical protein VMY42_20310 [Thermoguttaceae bacterium]|nr:hypothetical protein [Thermoguttaceae bacterium]
MKGSRNRRHWWRGVLLGLPMLLPVGLTGCQVSIGGQTLPSGDYMKDDVQYFPPGSEFKHAEEAAAQRQYTQEQALQR